MVTFEYSSIADLRGPGPHSRTCTPTVADYNVHISGKGEGGRMVTRFSVVSSYTGIRSRAVVSSFAIVRLIKRDFSHQRSLTYQHFCFSCMELDIEEICVQESSY